MLVDNNILIIQVFVKDVLLHVKLVKIMLQIVNHVLMDFSFILLQVHVYYNVQHQLIVILQIIVLIAQQIV